MAGEFELELGLETEKKEKGKKAAPPKLHKGKIEYAPPFYTINIAHVEHMPEFEVIGVNGEVIQVERGVSVPNIPQAFINVLKNAIASRQVKRTASDGSEFFEWQPHPAIPYQILEGPYDERKSPAEAGN